MTEITCVLRCLDNSHVPIRLHDRRETVLGRGPETKIKESRCSRNQVRLVPNFDTRVVEVTQIGRNACGVNGLSTKRDVPVVAKHGDRLELLLGQFPHTIEFSPESKESSSSNVETEPTSTTSASALSLSDSEDEEPLAKHLKTNSTNNDVSSSTSADKEWESIAAGKLLVYTPEGVKNSSYVAAYDLDHTLITTVSGSTFPKHKDDWKLAYPQVNPTLLGLFNLNYKIVIFTNQAGLSHGHQNVSDLKTKIKAVVKKLGVPAQVFVSTCHSYYRKPCPGMWEVCLQKNGNMKPDLGKSFYCGDAAGRDARPGCKKDFSQTDLLFATNINLPFVTPEYHFLKKKQENLKVTVFDPNRIPLDVSLCTPEWGLVVNNKLECVILVGSPGSGKSHFFKTHMESSGYVHINRDTLVSMANCLKAAKAALVKKQSIVIDNTNPDVESRKKFISMAKHYTPIVRCFVMNTTLAHVKHNIKFRQLTDTSHTVITDAIINAYYAKFAEPTLNEGFSEILKINFWPTFKEAEHERIYKLYLLEK